MSDNYNDALVDAKALQLYTNEIKKYYGYRAKIQQGGSKQYFQVGIFPVTWDCQISVEIKSAITSGAYGVLIVSIYTSESEFQNPKVDLYGDANDMLTDKLWVSLQHSANGEKEAQIYFCPSAYADCILDIQYMGSQGEPREIGKQMNALPSGYSYIQPTNILKTQLDGKAAQEHTHTPQSIGAATAEHTHTGTYAPASHNHSASNITSGTLQIGRGGTGASTQVKAREALGILVKEIKVTMKVSYYDSNVYAGSLSVDFTTEASGWTAVMYFATPSIPWTQDLPEVSCSVYPSGKQVGVYVQARGDGRYIQGDFTQTVYVMAIRTS